MHLWKFVSPHRNVSLEVNASDDDAINGTLTFEGNVYSVSGSWAASGTLGRKASAFGLGGAMPKVPAYIAATGIMTGESTAPVQIDIQIDTASAVDGTTQTYKGTLLPQ